MVVAFFFGDRSRRERQCPFFLKDCQHPIWLPEAYEFDTPGLRDNLFLGDFGKKFKPLPKYI